MKMLLWFGATLLLPATTEAYVHPSLRRGVVTRLHPGPRSLPTLLARKTTTCVQEQSDQQLLTDDGAKQESYCTGTSRWGISRSSPIDKSSAKWDGALMATTAALAVSEPALAATSLDMNSIKSGMTPETFQPVCSASDGLYRVLQQTAQSLVGPDNFTDYGPLIASGLLRVRLELCVVESFFNEAVGPFIRDNGLSWVLPLHETVETFLAGGIFALATTFILIGSTKLLTVIITYTDFLLGLPARLLGGFTFDRARGKPVTLDIGFGPFKTRIIGPPEDEAEPLALKETGFLGLIVVVVSGAVAYFGKILGFIREVFEAIDAFVGRYLVLWASFYLIIKILHFKVFPDFPY